ncbi:MAG: hypothetical protein U9Q22_03765 [Candidatus Altiarchaeota archaeon]|nr:hypothetical protein [Candidatus Altiarchaeota archaeon]
MKIRVILVMLVLIYCVRGDCESCRLPYSKVASDYVFNQSDDLMDDLGRDVAPKFGVSIFFPLSQVYPEGAIYFEAFVFAGTPPYSFEWTSDVDGVIGWDEEFSVRDLSVNTHRITLRVWDDAGLEATDDVSMTVTPRVPLQASILCPENATYGQGRIELISSIHGGEKPYTTTWMLDDVVVEDIDDIAAGIHRVSLRVTDSVNTSVGDTVKFTIVVLCNINGVCEHGETYLNCLQDCSGSKDNYCDTLRDGVCDPDCSRWEDMDCICNKDAICELGIENYLNCPKDCPSGLGDGYCDGLVDGVCDPDCNLEKDPDCVDDEWFNYFILSIFVLILVLGYLKFIRMK